MGVVQTCFSVAEVLIRKYPTALSIVYEFVKSTTEKIDLLVAGGLGALLLLLYAASEAYGVHEFANRHAQRYRDELRDLHDSIKPTLDYVRDTLSPNWRETNLDNFRDSATRVCEMLKSQSNQLKDLIDKIRSSETETSSRKTKVKKNTACISIAGAVLLCPVAPIRVGLPLLAAGSLATAAIYVLESVRENPLKGLKKLAGNAARVRRDVEASCADVHLKVVERLRTRRVSTTAEITPSARETDLEKLVALLAGCLLGISGFKWMS